MNRGVITISESGTVSMPTDTVWMTMQEIADMYNVFGCYVRKAVKAVFKDGILKEHSVRRHVRKNARTAMMKWAYSPAYSFVPTAAASFTSSVTRTPPASRIVISAGATRSVPVTVRRTLSAPTC